MDIIDTNKSEMQENPIEEVNLKHYSEQETTEITDNEATENLFGLRLKERRKELGLSQKEAADRVRVSISAYVRYEHGYIPNEKILEKITKGLDISKDWLLGQDDDNFVELKSTRRRKSKIREERTNKMRKGKKEGDNQTGTEQHVSLKQAHELNSSDDNLQNLSEVLSTHVNVNMESEEGPVPTTEKDEDEPFVATARSQYSTLIHEEPTNEGILEDQFNYLSSLVTISINNRDWEMVEATLQLLKMIAQRQQQS